eukprot:TRINITY_DN12206_c0_g1_i1.p1 TRINITY_DN12206_c0_g1~~TRINITY_DN12206_c0_g1_i1.p1  ORF type:complete len:258 (+),score=18.01 TRINITY_DN12206_c0_g1_i1:256-1029(+)
MSATDSYMQLINNLILSEDYRLSWYRAKLKRTFLQENYVALPNLFKPEVLKILQNEVRNLEKHTFAKNYRSSTANTPRYLNVIGGKMLIEYSPLMGFLYVHHELRKLISEIVDSVAFSSPHEQEVFGVHYLLDTNQTHGWHTDDGPFVLVICFDAPPKEDGGLLECIFNWKHLEKYKGYKEDNNLEQYVQECRRDNLVEQLYCAPGHAYLIAGNKVLHRVTPLTKNNTKRIVFASSYVDDPSVQFTDRVTGLYRPDT